MRSELILKHLDGRAHQFILSLINQPGMPRPTHPIPLDARGSRNAPWAGRARWALKQKAMRIKSEREYTIASEYVLLRQSSTLRGKGLNMFTPTTGRLAYQRLS